MENKLPTRERCLEIIQTSEVFYRTQTQVQGFDVEIYNYRLASYLDFLNNEAFELRGITFVLNPETKEWERNIALNKFFNVNQCQDWLYSDLKDKKVVDIKDKLDGSLITFVKLPNGEIVAKSKASFNSEQANMAQKIYDNDKNIRIYVNYALDKRIVPIFELVSPFNQIVLDYKETELILLQVRDGIDGEYFLGEDYEAPKEVKRRYHIKIAKTFKKPLDRLLLEKQTEKNIEGWVVVFDDGQMAKIKTDWYLTLHGSLTDGLKEHLLIKTILEESVDDLLSQLNEGEKRNFVESIISKITKQFNHLVLEFLTIRAKYFDEFQLDRKSFALAYSNNPLFGYIMKSISQGQVNDFAEKSVKDFLLRKTNSYEKAKEYLDSI
jgi:T4 RnlA family RNA ligase